MHADKLGPAVLLSHLIEMREFPAPHRTCANVAHFTALNEVVQGFHRFLGGDLGVGSVYLEEIKVRSLQARKRGIDRVEDGCAGEPTLVHVSWLFPELWRAVCLDAGIICDETKAFRRDHDLVTGDFMLAISRTIGRKVHGWGEPAVTYIFDELAQEAFRFAVGVEVGGIDRVDPEVPCRFDHLEGSSFVEDPWLDVDMRLRSP